MNKHPRVLATACAAVMALSLAACSNAGSASDDTPASGEAAMEETAVSREEIESILNAAIEADYTSVTFSSRTDTSATGTASNGQLLTQTMRTSMRGELDRSGETPALHIGYEAQSNMALGKTQYDMYINSENLIINQGGQLYVDAMSAEMLDSYADSVTAVTSAEEVSSILDMAGDMKMEQADDDTVITITVDKDKLLESELVDESSLPETSQIATMVVNYVIDSDSRFKTVRLMSSTSGTPTYRVTQTYQFSDYDATSLPEWPDLQAYIAEQSGISTDESGRMYIVGDDGQVYYVDSVDLDGTIHFAETPTTANSSGYDDTYYYYPDDSTSTQSGNTSSETSDSNVGRAYITAHDGTIHYLDEPGSEIRDLGGSTVFIDADGEWYFLNYGDDE